MGLKVFPFPCSSLGCWRHNRSVVLTEGDNFDPSLSNEGWFDDQTGLEGIALTPRSAQVSHPPV